MAYEVYRGDLKDTPYVHEPSCFEGVKLYFSSPKAIKRFDSRVYDEIVKGNKKIENIFKGVFQIDVALLSAIRLYMHEERRGFLVELDGQLHSQPHTIDFVLDGE